MILVDTSIWVEHLRRCERVLAELLETGRVLTHPFVVGELACGVMQARNQVLALMSDLPQAPSASDDEALSLVERRRLIGRGIGYIDVHLLASAILAVAAMLWTRDKRLAAIADELGCAFIPWRDGQLTNRSRRSTP
jgi:predicted nucleic acid-binding protein